MFASELAEGAVAEPQDAVVVVGLVALAGEAPHEPVSAASGIAAVCCGEFSAVFRGGLVEGAAGSVGGVVLDGPSEQLGEQPVIARGQTDGELAVRTLVVFGGTARAGAAPSLGSGEGRREQPFVDEFVEVVDDNRPVEALARACKAGGNTDTRYGLDTGTGTTTALREVAHRRPRAVRLSGYSSLPSSPIRSMTSCRSASTRTSACSGQRSSRATRM